MGLDMYLNRMPRYGNTTPQQIYTLERYFGWKSEPKAKKYSLKEWCGVEYKNVPRGKVMEFYKPFYAIKYWPWDTEKKFPHGSIMDEVGYWRKANQIHNWFVNHVQGGEDDCEYHNEVTKEVLEELLDICQRVLNSCEMVDGQIENGYTTNQYGQRTPIMEEGKYVKDSSVAEKLLPSCAGFFFGGYDYDEYYVADIKETIDIITKVLETTDFEKEMVYYISSW